MTIRLPFRILYSILLDQKKENFYFSQTSFCFGCQSSKRLCMYALNLVDFAASDSVFVVDSSNSIRNCVKETRESDAVPSSSSIACRNASCVLVFLRCASFCLQCLVCLLDWNRSVGDNTTFITWRLVWWHMECMRGRCF